MMSRLKKLFAGVALGGVVLCGASYGAQRNAGDLLIVATANGVSSAIGPIAWLGPSGADKANALGLAVDRGDIRMVDRLLKSGADVHADGDWALRWAAYWGNTELVGVLLDKGADVNAANGASLVWASGNGHLKTVELLLERGADVQSLNGMAIAAARSQGHEEIARALESWRGKGRNSISRLSSARPGA